MGCFAAIGAATHRCETPETFDEAVGRLLAGEKPALVLVDQHFASCQESIEALRRRGGAVVILLPAERQAGHPALDSIRRVIERAAGANILGEY